MNLDSMIDRRQKPWSGESAAQMAQAVAKRLVKVEQTLTSLQNQLNLLARQIDGLDERSAVFYGKADDVMEQYRAQLAETFRTTLERLRKAV